MRTLALFVLLLLGCAGEAPSTRCTPGAQIACVCVGGATVAQVCSADGAGFGPCMCPDAAVPDVTAPGPDALDVPGADASAPEVPALDVVLLDVARDTATESTLPDVRSDALPEVASCSCPFGMVCEGGRCVVRCADGFTLCGPGCFDLQTDRGNCGACGRLCGLPTPPGAMTASCVDGSCRLRCLAGFADCDGDPSNGCEADVTSALNCGACGRACAASQVCRAGVCVGCVAPQTECFGACVDTSSDPAHCGACGMRCPVGLMVGSVACRAGACAVTSCLESYADCDGSPRNGCETNLALRENCGRCGNVCPTGQACTASGCACPGSTTLCAGSCVHTDRDPANCGVCGNACSATEFCNHGLCEACPVDADRVSLVRCENTCVDLREDRSNCGACGNACSSASLCYFGRCCIRIPC